VRAALAVAGLLVVLSGCAEEPRRVAAVQPDANTACLQARVGSEPAAKRLPVATRTLAALQAISSGDPAVVRLRREYERLFGLYRVAATTRQGGRQLREAVAGAEDSVRSLARDARLPACSPP
jgi:hypothetical protein